MVTKHFANKMQLVAELLVVDPHPVSSPVCSCRGPSLSGMCSAVSLTLAALCRLRGVAGDLAQTHAVPAEQRISHVEARSWNKRGFFPLRLSQNLACASPLDLCIANTGREGRFSAVMPFPFLSLRTFFSVFAF